VESAYDCVLVDAPCSGTGTLRRRPELLLRRVGSDLLELSRLQRAILTRVARLTKPGGRLIYAVCSVLREEAEDVIADCAEPAGLEPAPFDSAVLQAVAGASASTLRLLPDVHGTDGYFVASFRRVRA
jgi:16S rRNA (cytosine967-C5)-methyltransferase